MSVKQDLVQQLLTVNLTKLPVLFQEAELQTLELRVLETNGVIFYP